jgi:hypothetical protein
VGWVCFAAAAKILDDVAELAFEGAATRGLNGRGQGTLRGIQVPARYRTEGKINALADVLVFPGAAFEIGKQLRSCGLQFPNNQDVALATERLGGQRYAGASHQDDLAAPAQRRGKFQHAGCLRDFSGDPDIRGGVIEVDWREVLVAD